MLADELGFPMMGGIVVKAEIPTGWHTQSPGPGRRGARRHPGLPLTAVPTRLRIREPGRPNPLPPDLAGKRIGTEQYQLTASVWLRGIFDDEAAVRSEDVTWVLGGQDEPGGDERAPLTLPAGVRAERIGPGETLGELLADAKIDALFAPHLPAIFRAGDPRVVRLFPDYPAVEADYHRRTGLFPIMHVVVIRSDVYEANSWTAAALFEAFREAKRRALERLRFAETLAAMVPWLIADLEAAETLFGDRYWPYGVEANRPELETLVRYARRQGITVRDLTVDELFVPDTLRLVDEAR